jgi:signal transduction histidine kinase
MKLVPQEFPKDAGGSGASGSTPDASALRQLQEAIQHRQQELRVLADVSMRLHGEEDVQAILDNTLDALLDGLGLQTAWIFLEDKDRSLRLAAHRGISPDYLELLQSRGLGECLCRRVFETGEARQAFNRTDCPRMPMIGAGLARPVAHASVPLAFNGTSRGVLNVAAPKDRAFDEAELRFLETVGRQVCVAVEGARHLRAERLYNQEARALAALNKGIGGESLEPEAVLDAVGRTALEILHVDRVHILLGSDPQRLAVAHLAGLPHPELRRGQVLDLTVLGDSLHRRALEQQVRLGTEDWTRDPHVNKEIARRWAGAAVLILPLVARRKTMGLLVLSSASPQQWTEDQVDVAEALASQASVALENARLYDNARRAYRELNEAQARIIQSEKMAVVGTFASGLAHEVRNPLNSIALQLSILERRVAPLPANVAGEIKELVGVIREEVKRLDNLVGDFLQFSRSNRVQYRPASLDELLDEVMRLLRPEARAAGVTLKRQRIGEAIPDLRVDPEKMKQVVINLVQNAIEAMPGGGVVTIESGLLDGRATMVVKDEGPGLPEGLDVFQLFVTTKAQGTGLGLSIAQQIVLEHGGEIAASSETGKGATFTVRLPVERPEPAAGDEA